MKVILKHKDFCDGCAELQDLHTLAQHKRCGVYKINMLPRDDLFGIEYKGLGYLKRPDYCVKENEVEIKK